MSLQHLRTMAARRKTVEIDGQTFVVKPVPLSAIMGRDVDFATPAGMAIAWTYGLHDAEGTRLFDPDDEQSIRECESLIAELGFGVAQPIMSAIHEVSGNLLDAEKN